MDTSISLNRIVQRAKEVATFNTRTYEEIVRDPSATMEAAIIVATVAIASGLGRMFIGPSALIGGVLSMLIGWIVGAAVIYWVGSRITGTPTTSSSVERVMRIVGYAAAPNVFMFLSGLWLIGWIFSFVLAIWTLITMILAIRASMGMTMSRAAITGGVAWIASLIVITLIGWIFGINPSMPF